MGKKQYTGDVEKKLLDEFKKEVEKQNKTISGAVEEAMELWLEKNEKKEK